MKVKELKERLSTMDEDCVVQILVNDGENEWYVGIGSVCSETVRYDDSTEKEVTIKTK